MPAIRHARRRPWKTPHGSCSKFGKRLAGDPRWRLCQTSVATGKPALRHQRNGLFSRCSTAASCYQRSRKSQMSLTSPTFGCAPSLCAAPDFSQAGFRTAGSRVATDSPLTINGSARHNAPRWRSCGFAPSLRGIATPQRPASDADFVDDQNAGAHAVATEVVDAWVTLREHARPQRGRSQVDAPLAAPPFFATIHLSRGVVGRHGEARVFLATN